MKFLTNIDLNLNQLLNALLHLLGSDPGSPTEGQVWYNTTTHRIKWRDNAGSHSIPARLDELEVPTSAVAFNAQKITGLADPTSAQDGATKAYVDATATGLDFKQSVRAATTANITLSAAQTIDGVSVIAGDRVLVKDQSSGSANGIYVAAAGAWSRATDADSSAEVTAGMYTWVEEGTANGDSGWVLTNNNPITLGTTALVFAQFSSAVALTLATITGTLAVAKGGTGGTDAATARSNLAAITRFAVSVGDGSATSYTVTHNLGTKDVQVTLYDNTTPFAELVCDVQHATTNTVTLLFAVAPTSNQYRCVVLG